MFILPLDSHHAVVCSSISFAFEILRILLAYMLARPSGEIRELNLEKAEASVELATIKSIHVEFVRHSLLTRRIIKIEKKIETIQADYAPKAQRVKNFFRTFRVALYIACGIYFSRQSVVMINPQLMWPLLFFTSRQLIYLSPVAILFISGLAFRHIFRSTLPVLLQNTTFP